MAGPFLDPVVIVDPLGQVSGSSSYQTRQVAAANIDWTNYDKFAKWFNVDLQAKEDNGEQILDAFLNSTKLKLSSAEKNFLKGVFKSMPASLRVIKAKGQNIDSPVMYINLLPVIEAKLVALQSPDYKKPGRRDVDKEEMASITGSLTKKIRKYYVDMTLETLASDPANAQRMQTMSEDQKLAFANQLVDSTDQSPLANITQGDTPIGAAPGTTSPLEETLRQAGYNVAMPTTGGSDFIDSWDEYLKANPNGTFSELVAKEYDGESFSDGFDMSGILDPNGNIPVKLENGQVKLWNAIESNNLIYDLYEKGDTGKIIEIQNMMLKAGYYADTRPIKGIVDSTTVTAWQLFLTDAARSNRSPADQFKFAVTERGKIRYGDVYQSPSDPVEVNQYLQTAGQSVLGRPLTPDEVISLRNAVLNLEKQAITSGLDPVDPAKLNFDARVNEMIRNQNQEELRFMTWDKGKADFEAIFGSM